MAPVPLVYGRGRTSNSGRKTFPHVGTRIKKNLVVEKRCNISRKSIIASGPSLRGEKPEWIFHNLGNLLRPLELVQPRVSEWFPRNGKSAQFLETACQEQK